MKLVLLIMVLALPLSTRAEIGVGSTRDEVVALLGEPELEITRRGRQVLYYQGEPIELVHNVVVKVDVDALDMARKTARTGLLPRPKPRPVTPVAAPPPRTPAGGTPHIVLPGAGGPVEDVKVIKNGGAPVDLDDLIVPGKVTIIDFYADWCGPCRRIAPALEQLARDREVVLRKVDIVQWGTPVARQYGLRSIPNVRVYGPDGKLVGSPTPDVNRVKQWVRRAKR